MATLGCGCKICKGGLGEFTNELVLNGESPKSVLKKLQNKGIKTTEKLVRKHLSAYQLTFFEVVETELVTEPIKVDLNKIDFSEYNFDGNNIESIIAYLQKINLKIYLNQSKITLQAQKDVIDGKCPDMPKEVLQNQAIAFQILDKSTGMSIHINQQEAIKTVEAMGLSIQSQPIYLPSNAENSTDTKAN